MYILHNLKLSDTPSANMAPYLARLYGDYRLGVDAVAMHLPPEKEPHRVERTQDGRWQVYYQSRPSKTPFVKEKLAFAHLKVCVSLPAAD